MRVGGIVLAGGRSRRMGSDKALLRVDGETLAARVSSALRAAGVAPIVVVRAADQADTSVPGTRLVVDRTPDQGPLEGIRAGLAALADEVDAVFVAPVDVPWLAPELVIAVVRALDTTLDADAVVPERDGRLQPLTAAYRLAVLPLVEELLATGERRARELPARCATVVLDVGALLADPALRAVDPGLVSLDDVDVAADLRRHP